MVPDRLLIFNRLHMLPDRLCLEALEEERPADDGGKLIEEHRLRLAAEDGTPRGGEPHEEAGLHPCSIDEDRTPLQHLLVSVIDADVAALAGPPPPLGDRPYGPPKCPRQIVAEGDTPYLVCKEIMREVGLCLGDDDPDAGGGGEGVTLNVVNGKGVVVEVVGIPDILVRLVSLPVDTVQGILEVLC